MAVLLADLDIRKEPSSIGGSQFPILFSKETKQILHQLKDVEKVQLFIYSLLLHEIFRYPEQEVETQTLDISTAHKYFSHYYRMIAWFQKELAPRELEHKALLSIASEFSKVEKVRSIYFQKYREELQVQILLSIISYESDLMDTLLDIEYDIRKRYPEIVFEFFYPPAGISDKKDFIHAQAQCIFTR